MRQFSCSGATTVGMQGASARYGRAKPGESSRPRWKIALQLSLPDKLRGLFALCAYCISM
ncbi:hypothetical protein FOXYSP1_02856 [Fusarium oxysporum f. sp. phaseoli]